MVSQSLPRITEEDKISVDDLSQRELHTEKTILEICCSALTSLSNSWSETRVFSSLMSSDRSDPGSFFCPDNDNLINPERKRNLLSDPSRDWSKYWEPLLSSGSSMQETSDFWIDSLMKVPYNNIPKKVFQDLEHVVSRLNDNAESEEYNFKSELILKMLMLLTGGNLFQVKGLLQLLSEFSKNTAEVENCIRFQDKKSAMTSLLEVLCGKGTGLSVEISWYGKTCRLPNQKMLFLKELAEIDDSGFNGHIFGKWWRGFIEGSAEEPPFDFSKNPDFDFSEKLSMSIIVDPTSARQRRKMRPLRPKRKMCPLRSPRLKDRTLPKKLQSVILRQSRLLKKLLRKLPKHQGWI